MIKSNYDHVFSQGKKMVTSEFIFIYSLNKLEHARLGLALSKKAVSKAHDRNRLKRILRETFRIKALPSVDVVVLARSKVADVEHSLLYTRTGKAWDRLSALCKQ